MRCETRRRRQLPRRGVVMVLFALLLIMLLGLVGLVVDGGFLLATHRQVQNAADAAALAAALDKQRGRSDSNALNTANTFLQTYNGLPNAPALVANTTFNIPPQTGPYAGDARYVEVIATAPVQTLFIHVLGINRTNNVTARAVAGYESVAAGEGVMVLDRAATPGLGVTGGGRIRVNGRVVVNSEGGGVDEFAVPVPPAADLPPGSVGLQVQSSNDVPPPGIYGTIVDVVGGAHDQSTPFIYQYTPAPNGPDPNQPSPFHARSLPEPDPLIQLPTPTTSNGVDATDYVGGGDYRGEVKITTNGVTGNIHAGYVAGENSQITAADVMNGTLPGPYLDNDGNNIFSNVAPAPFVEDDVILYPGIYREIDIQGGRTFLVPGIYVLAPTKQTVDSFTIGGNINSAALIVGRGVMFYNTGNSYSPANGTPDINDGERAPPNNFQFNDGTSFVGGFTFNKDARFSPINSGLYNYAGFYGNGAAVSSDFDGMLFYQRRRNTRPFEIAGNAADSELTGTIYAKWALFKLAGSGSYQSQFVVGSMQVSGGADVTILAAGAQRGRANQVFLVE